MMGLFITKIGYQAITARTAKKPSHIAEAECRDLIFMDMDLPDVDGVKTTAILKKNPKTSHIPVVALRRGCPHYWRKRLRKWVSQPTW